MSLQRLDASDSPSIEALAASARREGYVFLDRLLADLTENATLFDGPGAVLLGHFHAQHLVAVGGVMRDPYLLNAAVGRLQRVYVTPECRRTGIATLLVRHLLDHAGDTYTLVRLRVPDIRAARFYETVGFQRVQAPDATHTVALLAPTAPDGLSTRRLVSRSSAWR